MTFTVQAEDRLGFRRVVIDAGHGGKDPGSGRFGVKEKGIALDTALRLEQILRKRGIPTVMTRRDDRFIPLQERAKIGNRYADSIFVSIHYNSNSDSSVSGIETYYGTAKGKTLAAAIQYFICRRLKTKNRGIIAHPAFAVINKSRNPSVIVECGYLSNAKERRKCASAAYRQIMAEQIAKGILLYQR